MTEYERIVKTTVAGAILLALVATWLAMEWTGRQPDSIILLGGVAVALGAGYYLWDDAMGEGVEAAQELQSGDEGSSGGGSNDAANEQG
jgi:hypothetical protein